MKTRQTVIAASVAALLVSGNAFAKELHENMWGQVKSYGDVSLHEDSVDNWGPWAGFVEPAAGAPSPVQMPGTTGSDPYRNNPNAMSQGCSAGAWCGYAVFANTKNDGYGPMYKSYSESTYYGDLSSPTSGTFALTMTPGDISDMRERMMSGGTASWSLTSSGTTTPIHGDSGGNLDAYYYSLPYLSGMEAYRKAGSTSGTTSTYEYQQLATAPYGMFSMNPDVVLGYFDREVETYTSGTETMMPTGSAGRTDGFFVAGIATPTSYLSEMRAGNVKGQFYSGVSYDYGSRYVGPSSRVEMTVNFANATWTGSWNGGKDGAVKTNYDSKGNAYFTGAVGFNASGSINGANIQSTSVSALDGTVTGSVKGTFYGKTADSIAGVSDIVKTRTYVGNPSASTGPAPVAMPMAATTGSHVAVFLVNKGVNDK